MKHKIPFFSLERQSKKIKHNILTQFDELIENNQFVGGPYIEKFEKQFSQYTGSSYTISCNSGTDALWLALKALDIQPNSIVLTTPFSFIASCSEIYSHQANPVFIDVDESYNICPQKIESWLKLNAIMRSNKAFHAITGKEISGIIVVDLFGQCANYKEIKRIAKEWNLWIIEDACQAIGAHIENKKTKSYKKAGTFGDIACFSLYPTKNLGAFGDGGVITTSNTELAEKLFKLCNHGRTRANKQLKINAIETQKAPPSTKASPSMYDYKFYGKNSRLDAMQAIVATNKLLFIDEWNKKRREIAHTYTKRLKHISSIKTPQENVGYHVYHQYCIELTDGKRDELKKYLERKNIGTNIFYPKALNRIPFLTPPPRLQTICDRTEELTKNILALPVWPELTKDEVNYICESIEQFNSKTIIPKNSIQKHKISI